MRLFDLKYSQLRWIPALRLRHLLIVLLSLARPGLAEVDSLRSVLFGSEGFDLNYHHTLVKDFLSDDMIFVREEFSVDNGLTNYLTRINSVGETVWTYTLQEGGSNFNIQSLIQTMSGQYSLLGGSPIRNVNCDLTQLVMNEDSSVALLRSIINEPTDHGFSQLELPGGGMALAGYFGRGEDRELDLDFWLIKVENNGVEAFIKTYGLPDRDETCFDICQTADGGLLLAGIAGPNGYLVRVNSVGDTLWTSLIEGYENLTISSILPIDNGTYAIVGTAVQDQDMDGWFGVFNDQGIMENVREFGGESNDRFEDVIRTRDHRIVLVGSSQSYGEENGDMWLVKATNEGELLWSRTFGGENSDEGRSLVQLSDGSYSVIGVTNSFGRGNNDVWLVQTTSDPDIYETFTIQIARGWNYVSSPLPLRSKSFPDVWSDVVDNYHLMMVKDQVGRFYLPEFNFNSIPEWDYHEGYAVKMSAEDSLVISNNPIAVDTPIPLREGWNLVSYFPVTELEAKEALELLGNDLMMIKDDRGNFYDYDNQFSNLPPLTRGEGYLLRSRRATELIWNAGEIASLPIQCEQQAQLNHYPEFPSTGSDMSLIIETDNTDCVELAAFTTDGIYLGAINLNDAVKYGMAVRGDDQTTKEKDGAIEGDGLIFRSWNGRAESSISVTWTVGNGRYSENDLGILRLHGDPSIPSELSMESVYPNPFNGKVKFSYFLPTGGETSVEIVDVQGRIVAEISKGNLRQGYHTETWSADGMSSGSYFVRVKLNGRQISGKLRLLH